MKQVLSAVWSWLLALGAWCFENPRRGLITIAAILILVYPPILGKVVGRIFEALAPFIGLLLMFGMIYLIIKPLLPKRPKPQQRRSDR
ncbi:MAG: hypothetical protein HZB70_01220 [Candidatus Berkelbacteria bacterium]|nr:MAG: hypothetical protein HZB70_01220 [Candidatus Berkelbacteria bacterium]QQG52040.1 MAG: hypothetical protein HY845_01775 [Candidatus Berkelbacteria bacterium]